MNSDTEEYSIGEEYESTPIADPTPEIEIIDGKIVLINKNNEREMIQPRPSIIPISPHKKLKCEECGVRYRHQWKKLQVIKYKNGNSSVEETFIIGYRCIECNDIYNINKML